MIRKIVLLSVIFAALLCSGCSSWHIPFFGSEEAKEEEPLVQDAQNTNAEEPQYSGPTQPAAPAAQPAYGQPPAGAYGQNPAAGAFQPGQPYNPNANYAAGATPGYGTPPAPAYGAQPYGAAPQPYGAPAAPAAYGAGQPGTPAYGAYPGGQPAAPGAYGAQPYGAPPAPGAPPAYGQGIEQSSLGAPQGGAFLGAPAEGNLAFGGGIKRKVLFIISYPQRGLSTVAFDPFSQKVFQQLAAAPGINLVPREAVEQVSEKFLNQALDAKTRLSRLGKELGAQAIILERIQFVQNFNSGGYGYTPPKQRVQLQLIDTATGYPVKTYTLDPAGPGSNQVINSLVGNIRMIDWSARVIKVEKNRVLINAGRLTGLQTGQNLRVYAKGTEIKDPTTKLSLGQAQGALKGTIKVVDFFGIDGAICEPVAAGRFKQGDMVKAVE
jgi:outer membrane murein-binding lipoprotein Lpp